MTRQCLSERSNGPVEQGIETATFHILTPYPGTALHQRMSAEGRITTANWDLYDTRHVVFRPAKMTAERLEAGYWQAYRDFYRWGSIFKAAWTKENAAGRLRHLAYAAGWKKLEPLWDWVIRAKRVSNFLPMLETVLAGWDKTFPKAEPSLPLAALKAWDQSLPPRLQNDRRNI